ncbi:MAG: hypothetical protein SGI84_13290 [Gemmatimonadota bacterium]|nr:hypothetical protein [Gemmatimonadota bacterium]
MALLLVATPAVAQVPATVLGRVVRFAGPDTLPIPGAGVVLHRIGDADQGPLDSLRADPQGRFRFQFRADSSALYLLSATHHGITYFSSPVAREPATRTDDILLIVSDTSSTAAVRIAARSVILGGPEASGDRPVVEVIEFANRGRETRVAVDSLPTIAVALARGGQGFTIEDSDLSPDALMIRGDSLLVFAPLAPGARMVVLQYRLPAGVRRLELPAGLSVDTMQILLEPGSAELTATLPVAGEEMLEGRIYQRWMGAWPADSTLTILVTGVTFAQGPALAALVGGLVLAVLGGWWWLRRRRPRTPVEALRQRTAAELIEALARLDARYAGARQHTVISEWQRYEAERASLKAELDQALARSGARP